MKDCVQHAPYPGLRPFQKEDAKYFRGQDGQIASLYRRLDKSRFVTVMGVSGCGKSSLVRAGLVPQLNGPTMPGSNQWAVVVTRPGSTPVANLARKLAEGFGRLEPREAEQTLESSEGGILDIAKLAGITGNRRILIIVDQFEELFRYLVRSPEPHAQDEAAFFIKLLLTASKKEDAEIYVVTTMRSEYLENCSFFYGLAEVVNRGIFLLPRMSHMQCEQAIREPLGDSASISTPVVQRLLSETEDRQDGLPLLQHALREIWDRWRKQGERKEIGEADFAIERGNPKAAMVNRLLDDRLDGIYAASEKEGLGKVARCIFTLLSEWDEKSAETRRPTTLREVMQVSGACLGDVRRAIGAFWEEQTARAFLTAPNAEGKAAKDLEPEDAIDLSHECLMRQWRQLRSWMAEERENAAQFRRLGEAWEVGHEVSAGKDLTPEPAEASDAKFDPTKNRPRSGKRRVLDAMRAAIAASPSRVIADHLAELLLRRKSRDPKKESLLKGPQLAAFVHWRDTFKPTKAWAERYSEVKDPAATDPAKAKKHWDLGTLLAFLERSERAERKAKKWQRYGVASFVLIVMIALSAVAALESKARIEAQRAAKTEKDAATAATKAEAKQKELTKNAQDSARVAGEEEAKAKGAEQKAQRSAKSAEAAETDALNARDTATKSANDALRERNNAKEAEKRAQENETKAETLRGEANAAREDADNYAKKAGVARDEAQGLRDAELAKAAVRTADDLINQNRPSEALAYLAFALRKDRNSLPAQSATFDVLVRRLNRPPHEPYRTARLGLGSGNRGVWAALRRDGHQAAVALWHQPPSQMFAVGMWNLAEPDWTMARRIPENGQQSLINSVAFSPDGQFVVTASWDRTAKVWSVNGGGAKTVLSGHVGPVATATFSSDGKRILTASQDGTAKIFAVNGGPAQVTIKVGSPLTAATFSHDGSQVATASWNKTAQVWNATDGTLLTTLTGHNGRVNSAAFSPDGTLLVTASDDKTAIVWDVLTSSRVGVPLAHGATVNSAEFSPDGARVVTASDDKTARLWATESGLPISGALLHMDRVMSAAFSGDATLVITASYDGTASVWPVRAALDDVILLADLAEAAAGYTYDGAAGKSPAKMSEAERQKRRTDVISRAQGNGETAVLARWFLIQ